MTGRTTDCTIDWSPVTAADWDEHFRLLRRSTLLQHFPYAKAERVINQIGARHGIIKIDGVAAGLVQIGEVGLFRNLVHVVNLDRGPMWFEGFDTALNAAAFFAAFSRQFPKRFGRRIRVLPELEDCGPNRALMEKAGLAVDRAVAAPSAATVAEAQIVTAAAKVLSTEIAIAATNKLFELSGTRSTLAEHNLDRHWRNARTHTLHDPVRWKYAILGNYYLNGVAPPLHAWS